MIGSVGNSLSPALAASSLRTEAGALQSADLATQQQLNRLRATDQKVRQHEQAHLAAAGGLGVGGASFEYVRGPDGKQYAVAGEVQIDVSPAQDPKATLDKARRIEAAALAPADPSPQDLAVAAAAAQMAAEAQAELARQVKAESGSVVAAGIQDVAGASLQRDPGALLLQRALAAYTAPQDAATSLFHAQA